MTAAPLLVVGVLALGGGPGSPAGPADGARAARPAAVQHTDAAVPARRAGRPRATRAAARTGSVPEAVVVPALGIRAPVQAIELLGGALTPPADPARIGWWAEGAAPGAATGTAVLTGHTVHTGGGAFDRLEELTPGDGVTVRTTAGPSTYEVRSVQVLSREQLARRSADLFTQSGPARLVLVTCEDWDGTAYRSNVVVTALPVR